MSKSSGSQEPPEPPLTEPLKKFMKAISLTLHKTLNIASKIIHSKYFLKIDEAVQRSKDKSILKLV